MLGRLEIFPEGYPHFIPPAVPEELMGATEEQIGLWMVDQREDLCKQATEVYDLKRWVSVNCTVSLPYESWMQMSSAVREALVNEVNEVVRERDKASRDARERLESSLKGNRSGRLAFPVPPKNYTDSLMR
jgi:hypothetical protein